MNAAIAEASKLVNTAGGQVSQNQINGVRDKLTEAPTSDAPDSPLTQRWAKLLGDVFETGQRLGLVHPNQNEKARKLALKHLPSFVYYSNYGNLDSRFTCRM